MQVNVKLFPPLVFTDGEESLELPLPDGADIFRLLEILDEAGALAGYGIPGVFVLVENRAVATDYILKPGQVVKVLMLPMGG